MRSIAVGGIVAAIVMFALGFLFYGVLGMILSVSGSRRPTARVAAHARTSATNLKRSSSRSVVQVGGGRTISP